MAYEKLVFSVHAKQRMVERGVNEDDVRQTIEAGRVIEKYPQDTPYPSYLILGQSKDRPIHVVAADDSDTGVTIVITVYEPVKERWDEGLSRRKP